MAIAALNGEIVLFGGWSGGTLGDVLGDTWEWDGTSWTRVDIGDDAPPGARADAAMATLDGPAVMYGGLTFDDQGLSDTLSWNGSSWTLVTSAGPQARDPFPGICFSGLRAATASGMLVLLGGASSQADWEVTWNAPTWSIMDASAAVRPLSRSDPGVATLGAEVVMFGGFAASEPTDGTWTWDGKTWHQNVSSPSPTARRGAAMAGLP